MKLKTFNDLVSALQSGEKDIVLTRSILCNYPLMLPEGVKISGQEQENGELPLLSFQHSDGLNL